MEQEYFVWVTSRRIKTGTRDVEAYWSIHEGSCIIPTTWSVRRTLAWAGIKLEAKGLRSLHDPIPSLNQLIVNL